MENQWLTHAKRLQAIASTGLHYTKDEFDRERYREIGEIANRMLAELGTVPIERIQGLVSEYAKGYATPKVDVRGALIEDGKILLVRERSDNRWSLPGGFADVGRSASENVAKEIQEEAGITVSVRSLYAVRHKAKGSYEPDARDFYKLFFLCSREGTRPLAAGQETSEVGFFSRFQLPELSLARVTSDDIEAAFAFNESAAPMVMFD